MKKRIPNISINSLLLGDPEANITFILLSPLFFLS